MARNEEKQLARLNRLYLKQQREEEIKKRPPRPKLDTLNSTEDIKKWLPSIMRDIEFYVKQMEVTCYPRSQIDEFESRIDCLRGEYKAFVRKLRQLDPDLRTTPWSDRPYAGKHKKLETSIADNLPEDSVSKDVNTSDSTSKKSFIPLSTPVLQNDSFYQHCYGFEKPKVPPVTESGSMLQNEPLQFDFNKRSVAYLKLGIAATSETGCGGNVSSCQSQMIVPNNGTGEACIKKSLFSHGDSCEEGESISDKETFTFSHHNNYKQHIANVFNVSSELPEVSTEDPGRSKNTKHYIRTECDVIIQSTKPSDSIVSGKGINSSQVTVLGNLNISYSDSSDGET